MPKLQLSPCEAVEITFAETDGKVTVAFASPVTRSLVGCDADRAKVTPPGISVHVDLPDDLGRVGIVYNESGVADEPDLEDGPDGLKQPVKGLKAPEIPAGFSPVLARDIAKQIRESGVMTPLGEQAANALIAAASLVDSTINWLEESERDSGLAAEVVNTLKQGK
jgi:hypothetical protein